MNAKVPMNSAKNGVQKMTLNEFKEGFKILAGIAFRDPQTIEMKTQVYFHVLSNIDAMTWLDCVDEAEKEPGLAEKGLRSPEHYLQICKDIKYRKWRDGQISYFDKPIDRRGMIRFLNHCIKKANEKAEECTGTINLAGCIGLYAGDAARCWERLEEKLKKENEVSA